MKGRRHGPPSGFMRQRMKQIAGSVAREVRVCRLVLEDPRTPRLARFLIGSAVAYALSPIDLIPDFIPLLGYLDDALIVPLLIALGLALVPAEVIREHRRSVGDGKAGFDDIVDP